MKKALSALLAAVLVLGLLALAPITAHAATLTASDAAELATALAAAGDNTIRLTANITYNDPININTAKTITLDLNGKTLNATGGLSVTNGGKVLLLNPASGAFNVTGSAINIVDVRNTGSKAEVTSAACTGTNNGQSTVATETSGEIIVYGNVTATVSSWGYGAWVNSGKITVKGSIQCSGSGTGASVQNSGQLIVDGTITVATGPYLDCGGTTKTQAQYEASSTKPGYLTYTDGTSTVWVKDPATGGGGDDPGDCFVLWGKTTTYLKSNFWNWILLIFCFGWIWMAF